MMLHMYHVFLTYSNLSPEYGDMRVIWRHRKKKVPNIRHYVCHMFVAAELFIMDFNVYTAELSHTDFKSRNIKATVKCLNIFTELYVQYIYSYTVLQHLFFLSPSYYSKV